ncbi:MAG TPA: hypothetical protein VGL49_04715 [Acidimicrobiales bacterium]
MTEALVVAGAAAAADRGTRGPDPKRPAPAIPPDASLRLRGTFLA